MCQRHEDLRVGDGVLSEDRQQVLPQGDSKAVPGCLVFIPRAVHTRALPNKDIMLFSVLCSQPVHTSIITCVSLFVTGSPKRSLIIIAFACLLYTV